MKKLLAIFLCIGLLLGCSSQTGNDQTDNNKTPSASNVEVKDGDIVKIDFVGKLNGTAFQGGTANNYMLEIGSGSFVPGFEEQIVGMKVNEQKTIKVTFPKNYQSQDLANKETTFDITVHNVYQESKETCKSGDIVKIDYVGKLNGTAFQGGTDNGYLLEIGSGAFIPGFEDQIIGMKTGETKTIKVTFPENYQSQELAGKETTFDVSVNHLYREAK